jgi:hypothetical protein
VNLFGSFFLPKGSSLMTMANSKYLSQRHSISSSSGDGGRAGDDEHGAWPPLPRPRPRLRPIEPAMECVCA